LFFNFRYQ